ncbi:MAG TPA: hypothetical protein VGF38_11320 [Ktedonobacterales bacterium]
MNALNYYPTSWDRIPLAFSGLALVALAIVALALMVARRDTLVARSQALACGLCIGTAGAIACGIGFLFAQSQTRGPAFFLAPDNFRMGLLGGIGLGLLSSLTVVAIIALRSAAIAGLLIGTVIGLVVFRLIFGPTAGFGGEVGFGVGQEVGIMFGAAGGLLGGIVGNIFGLVIRRMSAVSAHSDTYAPSPAHRGWRWPLIGLALGAVIATLIAVLGAQMGIFQFLVPYNGQIPDVPPDTSPTGMQHDFLFGLGMFAVGGALIGCFLGLQWMSSRGTGVRRHSVWLGMGLIVALICGLTFGLDHRYVGGPFIPRSVLPDPVAGMRGLLIGLAAGVVIGGALALLTAHISNAAPRRQVAARMALVVIVGLLLLTLPDWYTPLFAISIM